MKVKMNLCVVVSCSSRYRGSWPLDLRDEIKRRPWILTATGMAGHIQSRKAQLGKLEVIKMPIKTRNICLPLPYIPRPPILLTTVWLRGLYVTTLVPERVR